MWDLPRWLNTLGYALAISTAYEVLYYLHWKYYKNSSRNKVNDESEVDVVFFPDQTVACEAFFSYGCRNKTCWLAHEETSSMRVKQFLGVTKRTLDICVYCIASKELVDLVIKAHSLGVIVRVLTDQENAKEHQDITFQLRSSGIDVRTNDTSFFMHHKFVISDKDQLMTGSFNWSRNAMLGNDENVLFIKNAKVVSKYRDLFDQLWIRYENSGRIKSKN